MSEETTSGRIGIVDGKVVVTDPRGDGSPAVLYPADEGLTVFINNELLEEPREVFADDDIEITPLTLTDEATCSVEISPDAYTATLAVFPRITTEYKLLDAQMSPILKLQTEKIVKRENALTLEDADAELKAKNVVYGVDFATLKKVIDNASGEPEVVAMGKEVQEGKNGWIEFHARTEVETITHEDSSESRVDFRERYRFPAVKKGELIAVVHAAVPGVSGQTVTGKIIVPKAVKNARFKCGEGVDFLEEKGEIVASRDGRLVVNGNVIKVINLVVHNGDVDLASGNLHFNGDIRINGNIMENMLVEAKGDLYVEGSAYGASIKIGGGATITKNVIKCDLEGGLFYALLKDIIVHARKMEKEYANFLSALEQVVSSLAEKGQTLDKNFFQRIVRAVLQKMSLKLQEHLDNLNSILKSNDSSRLDSLKETVLLIQKMLGGGLEIDNLEIPVKLGNSLRDFLDKGEDFLEEIPPLNVAYVQNSVLKHSGDINISGTGSYYSLIKSGGKVNVEGVFRGGSIDAMGDVRVKEFLFISTTSDAWGKVSQIRIKVPAHSFIYFDLVHEDVAVQVGKMVYRFDSNYSRVKIGYDPESGTLRLTNF